jgi:hypothetical protein
MSLIEFSFLLLVNHSKLSRTVSPLMDTQLQYSVHIGALSHGGLASLRVLSPRHKPHRHGNLRVESDIWIPLAPILFGSITSAQLHWGCGDTFTVIPSAYEVSCCLDSAARRWLDSHWPISDSIHNTTRYRVRHINTNTNTAQCTFSTGK